MADTEATEPKQDRYRGLKPFQPGQSGNPAGRPVGSRNKLGEAFVADLLADWEENGAAAIQTVRAEKPDQYLKVVASVIPKEVNVTVTEYDDLPDDELARRFAALAAQLTAGSKQAGGRTGATAGISPGAGTLPN